MQSSPQENNGFEKVEKEVRCESPVEDFVLVPEGLQGENSGMPCNFHIFVLKLFMTVSLVLIDFVVCEYGFIRVLSVPSLKSDGYGIL